MKNSLIVLLMSAVVCIFSVLYCMVDVANTDAIINNTVPTIIIDAGHAALENTIKTPKNHRQASVEKFLKPAI